MKFINYFNRFFGAAAALFLVACQEVPSEKEPDNAQACNAEDYEYLLWQPESVLETVKFGNDTRIIQPGMMVTMDFREDRLNIEIGESGRIERVYCG